MRTFEVYHLQWITITSEIQRLCKTKPPHLKMFERGPFAMQKHANCGVVDLNHMNKNQQNIHKKRQQL